MITMNIKRFLSCALVACLLLLVGCGAEEQSDGERAFADYSVTLLSEGGMPLEGVQIAVYCSDTGRSLVTSARTDKNGSIAFNALESSYVATFSELPDGHFVEECTLSKGDNVIKTDIRLTELSVGAKPSLGDVMFDFAVTDINGNEYTISGLLEDKKAVVLNFWYVNCPFCLLEFPALAASYAKHSDDLEVLALDIDASDSKGDITAIIDEYGLNFPVAMCDNSIAGSLSIHAAPTTVVIDRYGMICYYHVGAMSESDFDAVFDYVISDGYVQKAIRNVSEIQ